MTQNIAYLLGRDINTFDHQESDKVISNSIGIGVELEIENVDYHIHNSAYPNIFTFWRATHDGSLRKGTEFTFDGPMKGSNIIAALNLMQSFLDKYTYEGNPPVISDRCSVHVHLDVSDLNKEQLNTLIQIYYLIERLLFRYINPLRLKNNYCRALTDSSFKYTLKRLLDNKSEYSLFGIVNASCDKYSALNVLPVTSFGSVEFRHHHGTLDMVEVLNWINIIMALKIATLTYSIQDLLALQEESGTFILIQTILKGSLLSDGDVINSISEFDELVYKGLIDLKEIHHMDTLNSLRASFNKKRRSKSQSFLEGFKKEHNIFGDF